MMEPETVMRALADGTRLRIVNLLQNSGELCVCEITAALRMAQPKVSRHLAILRKAGLVRDRREGLWIHYRIHPELPLWIHRLLESVGEGCREWLPCQQDVEWLASTQGRDRTESCKDRA